MSDRIPLCCRCGKVQAERGARGWLAFCGDACRAASAADFAAGAHRKAEASACLGDWDAPVLPREAPSKLHAGLRAFEEMYVRPREILRAGMAKGGGR